MRRTTGAEFSIPRARSTVATTEIPSGLEASSLGRKQGCGLVARSKYCNFLILSNEYVQMSEDYMLVIHIFGSSVSEAALQELRNGFFFG